MDTYIFNAYYFGGEKKEIIVKANSRFSAYGKAAKNMGWRTFFVGDSIGSENVTCPASKEAGQKTTCDNCRLCMGTQSKAKSVKILKH